MLESSSAPQDKPLAKPLSSQENVSSLQLPDKKSSSTSKRKPQSSLHSKKQKISEAMAKKFMKVIGKKLRSTNQAQEQEEETKNNKDEKNIIEAEKMAKDAVTQENIIISAPVAPEDYEQ
jgi:hypothetical protein